MPSPDLRPDSLVRFRGRLRLPLIAAPMFLVSGVDLVTAACVNGVIGAFPTVNCRAPEELDVWLSWIGARLARDGCPSPPECIESRLRGPLAQVVRAAAF